MKKTLLIITSPVPLSATTWGHLWANSLVALNAEKNNVVSLYINHDSTEMTICEEEKEGE